MKDSLRGKFLIPVIAGAALLIMVSALITYLTLLPELRSQLFKRAELMTTTIRAAGEINPNYQDLRLALEEITLQTSGVYGITLATLNPTIIWASSTHPDADIDTHTVDMLQLLELSSQKHIFGQFIHKNGDLIVISPFKKFQQSEQKEITPTTSLAIDSPITITQAYSLPKDGYEGILYLRFNWQEFEALVNSTLRGHMMAMSAGILLMMLLSIATVYKAIINPIRAISTTIRAQKAGNIKARTQHLSQDEIGLLGQSLNEMLDAQDDRDRLLKVVVNHLPVGLSLKGLHDAKTVQNDAYKQSYLSPYLKGQIREQVLEKRVTSQHRVIKEQSPVMLEEHLEFKDDDKHFETTIFPIFNHKDRIEWLGTLCVDITEKKARELKLTQLYMAVESVTNGIIISDAQAEGHPILYANPAVSELTGYQKADLIGVSPRIFSRNSKDQDGLQVLRKAILNKEACTVILRNSRKDGSLFWNEFTLSVIQDPQGNATHFVGIQNDVTDRVEAENRIEHLAYYDALTNIPNRTLFHDRLTQVIAEAKRHGMMAAIIYIDLDGFKAANDTYGHVTGDTILQEAAKRMQACLRSQDSVARLGGDEFTILLPHLSDTDVIVNVPKVVKRLNTELNKPYSIDGNIIHTSGSIGISIYPKDGDSSESLIMSADHAMYHAKQKGKNTFSFFQKKMNLEIEKHQQIEAHLRGAKERGEFALYYQPQVMLHTQEVSLEALIRWHNNVLGDVGPDDFITIAESSGMIDEIGAWVIEQSCSDYASLQSLGHQINKIAINISAYQFKRQNIAAIIKEQLDKHQLHGSCLEIEITETAIFNDFDFAKTVLQEIREMGVTIAIDDFGTGYSSLTYLKRLPIDTIKIDRQFIKGLPENKDDQHIVMAISGMAKGMGLKLLAEGVETQEQLNFVEHELNCKNIQGFLFSKPLSKTELINSEFLNSER